MMLTITAAMGIPNIRYGILLPNLVLVLSLKVPNKGCRNIPA
jgi:hypothetical protein